MKKIVLNIVCILTICVALIGCAQSNVTPVNVVFKNATLYGSDKYTITAVYSEDKRIRGYHTDILVSSNIDNLQLTICKELEQPYNIILNQKDVWYSLTNLINSQNNEKLEFTTFARAETTTYIIQSEQAANLKFKAIGGDLCDHLKEGYSELVNIFPASKIFKVKISN